MKTILSTKKKMTQILQLKLILCKLTERFIEQISVYRRRCSTVCLEYHNNIRRIKLEIDSARLIP